MATYKIEYDRDTCIGSYACHGEAPELFQESDDGKVVLTNGIFNDKTGCWETVIDETDLETSKSARQACPVEAIKVRRFDDAAFSDAP
jgi:ferredoxin